MTIIESLLFGGCDKLESIVLPDTITTIDDHAFTGCPIKKVVIPPNVKEIGFNPFIATKKLECMSEDFVLEDNTLYTKNQRELILCKTRKKKFKVPDGVQVIRPFAFYDSKVESVTLPESIHEIADNAFDFSQLRTINLPQGITAIGDYAFSFSHLESIDLPDNITRIGEHSFEWCGKLKEVHFPNNLEEIGNDAFYLCQELCKIQLPEKLRIIGNSAFAKCNRLTEITLPESVEHIGLNPFIQIENLTLSCLTQNYKIEKDILYSKDGKNLICLIGNDDIIQIPDGVEVIGADAFNHKHITSLSLPSTLRKIEKEAFTGCVELSEIHLPNTVSSIGESAFEACKKLSEINLPDTILSIGERAFRLLCT